MSLMKKLVGLLSRAFDRSEEETLALRIDSTDANCLWSVADGFLTTKCPGGLGATQVIDLSTVTIAQLAAFFAELPGYSVPYVSNTVGSLSALTLLEGSGAQNTTNGDHLFAYTNEIFAVMGAYAAELTLARQSIQAMPAELSTVSADGVWLDLIGSYYAVPRNAGEIDATYALRIVAQTLMPKGNNVALEIAIESAFGQPVTVTDTTFLGPGFPAYNGQISYNGAYHYTNSAKVNYNVFNVQVGFDLINGVDPTSYTADVIALVNKLRDAGNYMLSLQLTGSTLTDTAPRPVDSAELTVTTAQRYGGKYRYDGTLTYSGSTSETEAL